MLESFISITKLPPLDAVCERTSEQANVYVRWLNIMDRANGRAALQPTTMNAEYFRIKIEFAMLLGFNSIYPVKKALILLLLSLVCVYVYMCAG